MTPNLRAKPNPAERLTHNAPFPDANPDAVKKKIQLVEDRLQIRESLHNEDYEVVLAANGQEVIKQSFAVRFILRLLDMSLPDISAREVFEMLNAINPFVPSSITGKPNRRNSMVLGAAESRLWDGAHLISPITNQKKQHL